MIDPRRAACALMLVALVAPGLGAQTGEAGTAPPDLTGLSLDELLSIDVVYGASKYEQKVTQAPSSVSIVTADDIRRYGYNTLADILGSVRGFYTTYDRDYSYIGVRGFQRPGDFNMRTLILVDGHRMNDNIYQSVLIGTDGILNVDDIDRVEVIREPSSSIYGAGAFFAVINIVTRSGHDLGGFELSGGSASYNTEAGRLAYGKKTSNGGEIFASGSTYYSGGQNLFYKEFDSPATNNGLAENVDRDGFTKFFGKVSFRDFTLEGAYSSREKYLPTGVYGTVFDDPRNQTLDQRSFVDLKYDRDLSPRASVLGRVYYDNYWYQGSYLYAPTIPQPQENLFVERAYAYTYGTEAQFTAKLGSKHTLMTGGEYRDHSRQDYYAFDASGIYGVYSDLKRTSWDWGLFVQDQYVVSKRLSLNFGLRHDRYPSFGGTTKPRLAVIFAPTERAALKFLYGEAYRAPSTYELFYGAAANPNLEAETIATSEIVLERYIGNDLRISGSVFRNRIDNLITLNTTTGLFENLANVDSQGLELELERKWKHGLGLRVDYALQQTTDRADNGRLSDSPRQLAKLHLSVPLYGPRLSSGLEIQYTGPRLALAGNEVGGFVIANLTFLSLNLAPNLDLSASVYNLTDKPYADPASRGFVQDVIAQDGRRFRLKLTWRF